jgi:hypothetical protein
MASVVKFSAVASCACCLCVRQGTRQRTTKGWHTAVNHLITPNVWHHAIEFERWWRCGACCGSVLYGPAVYSKIR